MSDDKEKPVIVAFITHIDCSICDAPQTGFVDDPRCGNFDCSECGKPSHVPVDAVIYFG